MKIFKISYYQIVLSCLIVGSLSFSSCKKDEEDASCNGIPRIDGVYQPDRTSPISEGTYNEFIIIKGENLCSLNKLMFNDVEVDLARMVYAVGNEITVKVPNTAPDQITNKVVVETSQGEASYDFKINIPPVLITSVDNEYAPVNTDMVLVGQSFDLAGLIRGNGKLYFGSNEATIVRATADSLFATVPAGAVEGDIIKIIDKNGAEFPYQYPYKDNTNMVVNYDDKPSAVWGRANYIGQDELPGAISGNYAHFVEKPLRTGFAQDQFVKGKVILPQDVVDNPGNYLLKFEVNTSLSVSMAGIRIFADLPSNKYYAWSPTTALPFNTRGKWVTHSISLQAANGNTTPLAARANNQYEIRGIVSTGVAFNMDISFDNWRIVAKPDK